MLVLNVYKSKTIKKILLQILRKNPFSDNYSHFLPALEEAKNVARAFSTYFYNDNLKNEKRELAESNMRYIFQ